MLTRDVDYRCDEVNLRGYLAFEDQAGPRPGVGRRVHDPID
jgi:hypothetical protein